MGCSDLLNGSHLEEHDRAIPPSVPIGGRCQGTMDDVKNLGVCEP